MLTDEAFSGGFVEIPYFGKSVLGFVKTFVDRHSLLGIGSRVPTEHVVVPSNFKCVVSPCTSLSASGTEKSSALAVRMDSHMEL